MNKELIQEQVRAILTRRAKRKQARACPNINSQPKVKTMTQELIQAVVKGDLETAQWIAEQLDSDPTRNLDDLHDPYIAEFVLDTAKEMWKRYYVYDAEDCINAALALESVNVGRYQRLQLIELLETYNDD